jgi:hypothetical protein
VGGEIFELELQIAKLSHFGVYDLLQRFDIVSDIRLRLVDLIQEDHFLHLIISNDLLIWWSRPFSRYVLGGPSQPPPPQIKFRRPSTRAVCSIPKAVADHCPSPEGKRDVEAASLALASALLCAWTYARRALTTVRDSDGPFWPLTSSLSVAVIG